MKRDYRQMLRLSAVALVSLAAMMWMSCRPGEEGGDSESQVSSEVVAKIGDATITKDELKQRLAQETRPRRDDYGPQKPPPTVEAVLRKMVAEKAIALEARELGYLDDESLSASLTRFRQRQLIQLFLTDYVMTNVPASDAEIADVLAEDPNLTSEQAEMKVRSTKAGPAVNELYGQLVETLKLEKVRDNFPKAAQIHQRLQTKPAEPRSRGMFWITNKQIRNELSEAEKQMVLARYTGGQVTLYDWFQALGQIAPPGRPKNLNTVQGVESLLDRALQPIIYAAEAMARGYDQNPEFVTNMREREDMMLLGKLRSEKYKEAVEPGDEEVKDYFEAHREEFAKNALLNVEQVWCPDLATAEKVKQMVTDGTSFEAANEAHGLRKNQKPHNIYPGSEGLFWDELWQAEPNDVVGPIKGFYDRSVQWRVVKILEKTPAELQPYSENLGNQVRSALMSQQREKIMAAYEAEMLKKYPHEIFADRLEGIDPLEVVPLDEPGR